MEKLSLSVRNREEAQRKRLLVLHQNGSAGYITYNGTWVTYNGTWDFRVKFPDWNKTAVSRTSNYTDTSTSVTLYNIPYEQYCQQGTQIMNALYEITNEGGSKTFAVKVAEKSKTLWVMEIKGTGEFKAVETSLIQEVVPYTVKVKCLNSGALVHHEAEEGKFSVGDIVLLGNGDIASIVEVNTKQKGVSELKARKRLVTADI